MSKSTYPAKRNLAPYVSPTRLSINLSIWQWGHSRIRRAMRIAKRKRAMMPRSQQESEVATDETA